MAGNYLSLGEFIAECQTFPYSKEHYEIIREAYEIDLGRCYIESMDFQRSDEYYMYESMMNGYPSEYFHEYEEYISEAEENEAKEGSFFSKIGRFFKDIGDRFIKFLTRIGDKCENLEKFKNEAAKNDRWYKIRWDLKTIQDIEKYLKADFKMWKDFELVGDNLNARQSLRFEGDVPEDYQDGFTKYMNAMMIEGITIKDENIDSLVPNTKEKVKEKVLHHPVGYIATAAGAPILVNKAWSLASDFLVKKFNDWRTNDYGDKDLKAANEELSWFYADLRAGAEKKKSSGEMDADSFESMMIKISNYERNHAGKTPTTADDIIAIFRTLTGEEPSEGVINTLKKIENRRNELKQQKDDQNANENNKAKKVVDSVASSAKNALSGSVGNTIANVATNYKQEIGAVLGFASGIFILKRWKSVTRKHIQEFASGKIPGASESQDESE